MKKKGFTLIELLAVIVILAIIALIAAPLVLKYIETSRKSAAKMSANEYAEAVEKEVVNSLIVDDKITDGNHDYSKYKDRIKIKGDKPSEGCYTITNGMVIGYSLKINNYVVTKKGNKIDVKKQENTECNVASDVDKITWDGNTNNKDVIPGGDDSYFYLVSEYVPTKEELLGATITRDDNEQYGIFSDDINIEAEDYGIIAIGETLFVITKNISNSDSDGNVITMKAGTYLYKGTINNDTYYIKEVDFNKNNEMIIVEWDGTFEDGVTSFALNDGSTLYHVSESVPEKSQLINSIMYYNDRGFYSKNHLVIEDYISTETNEKGTFITVSASSSDIPIYISSGNSIPDGIYFSKLNVGAYTYGFAFKKK